jgi:DNA-binding XRE family transcriptional regulator
MKRASKKIKLTSFQEHLDKQYGKIGTLKRDEFEARAKAFLIGELIKAERRSAKITQEQLAERIGAKKSFISRIENGKTDIQLSTLYRLMEIGLGKTVRIVV